MLDLRKIYETEAHKLTFNFQCMETIQGIIFSLFLPEFLVLNKTQYCKIHMTCKI